MIDRSDRKSIFNHGWVESHTITNYNEVVDDIELLKIAASTIYQKNTDFNDIIGLQNRLKTEAALRTPSRVLEFIPRVIIIPNRLMEPGILNFLRYCYVEQTDDGNFRCFTNLRNVIKNLPDYVKDMVSYSNDYHSSFFIVKMFIPMFIRDQFMTHTQLSKLNRSYRVSKQEDNKYWIPEDFLNSDAIQHWIEVQRRFNSPDNIEDTTANFKTQMWFKKLGYPKEIWTRFGTQNRYGEMIMAGWLNDPNSWQNFFLERGCKPEWRNWVQKETRVVAEKIYNLSQEKVYKLL